MAIVGLDKSVSSSDVSTIQYIYISDKSVIKIPTLNI